MLDISTGKVEEVTLIIGKERVAGHIVDCDDRLYFLFPFWKSLNVEIKMMADYKFHGYDDENPAKLWSVKKCTRNWFTLDFLKGRNPYARFDTPLQLDDPKIIQALQRFPLREHQVRFMAQILQRKTTILAAEMGTGKTLPTIAVRETVNLTGDYWYVAPKSVLRAIEYEHRKWKARFWPRFMTYEELVRVIRHWKAGDKAPQMVVFDESSRIKTATSQRSKAAFALAEGVRGDWFNGAFILELSGTPAPKQPVDWWHQAEVAQPGFLKEGNQHQLMRRLAVIKDEMNPVTNTTYPSIKAWRDGSGACDVCGVLKDLHYDLQEPHPYKEAVNEVANMYERLSGLVMVCFKKDCMDLPDKIYKVISCPPSPSMKNIARTIKDTAPTAIGALVSLRELSDGFQYVDVEVGSEVCNVCGGKGEYKDPQDDVVQCSCTDGRQPLFKRQVTELSCPKDDIINDLLDEHADVGRIIFYAGFTASIDKIANLCRRLNWHVIKVDGRGWEFTDLNGNIISDDPLVAFQDQLVKYPNVAFVAHPGSAGMGLTLTASPTICYYSNDFNAESRIQSEDRIHRPGMDLNRGATIIDLVHLPSDELVLQNLRKKKILQAMTMGELESQLSDNSTEERVV
jgi:hypothetical protein